MLIAYLLNNYAHSLEAEDHKADALQKMEKAGASMPALIREVWEKEQQNQLISKIQRNLAATFLWSVKMICPISAY